MHTQIKCIIVKFKLKIFLLKKIRMFIWFKHPNNALAKHYSLEHLSLSHLLNYKVLKSHLNSDIKRKISKALFIRQLKPELNARDEMHYITRFLV